MFYIARSEVQREREWGEWMGRDREKKDGMKKGEGERRLGEKRRFTSEKQLLTSSRADI